MVEDLTAAEREDFEVWPVNMPVIDVWLAICGQWSTVALADGKVHWHGLDYARVKAGLELAGIAVAPVTWAGVQVMERAATTTLNGG